MADELAAPDTPDELYRTRGGDVSPSRPLLQGDVFRNVEIPGVGDEPGLGIVLQHACSMRNGSRLREKLLMARCRPNDPIPLDRWNGYYSLMPLPELIPGKPSFNSAVFDLCGLVLSSRLSRADRIACLDDLGICLLE